MRPPRRAQLNRERTIIQTVASDVREDGFGRADAVDILAEEIIAVLARGRYEGQALSDRRQELQHIAARAIAKAYGVTADDADVLPAAEVFAHVLAEAVEVGDPRRARAALAFLITRVADGGVGIGSREHLDAADALTECDDANLSEWATDNVLAAANDDLRTAAHIAAGTHPVSS